MQRENGTDDIDFYQEQGGDKWLQDGLKTNLENGISSNSIPERERAYGHNRKTKVVIKSFLELCWEALDDFILWVLLFLGIVSGILNVIVEEEERSTAWLEGFAILIAVFVIVVVTAYNDREKEMKFQQLNDLAERGKKVSVIRDS